jgi:hypothetical protein
MYYWIVDIPLIIGSIGIVLDFTSAVAPIAFVSGLTAFIDEGARGLVAFLPRFFA